MLELGTQAALAALKAAAEPTRLRILALLSQGELNVSDLTRILSQSQPRISRHLKLLTEAGLIERFREGSWVYFQLVEHTATGQLGRQIVDAIAQSDVTLVRDRRRAEAIKAERETTAQAYFQDHAAQWDRIRAMHISEAEVEAAVARAFGDRRLGFLVDLGTGTGRMLELLASRSTRVLGLDVNHAMLAYARSRLERAGITNSQVRHGDIYNLPLDDGVADGVVMHQVLHFLSDPARAVAEAVRILAPGGRIVIVDFAPHSVEELRTQFRHERLGFATTMIEQWLCDAGLDGVSALDLPQKDATTEQLTVRLWVGARGARPLPASRERETPRLDAIAVLRG